MKVLIYILSLAREWLIYIASRRYAFFKVSGGDELNIHDEENPSGPGYMWVDPPCIIVR